ncbi:MAG TPA: ferritin [Fibrobacteres bacterium]|jgi:ferritin|nr:ferritin [Fibrobacterota bacterium]
MLSKKMEEAINEQINREMYSAYLYMGMSADSTFKGLKGFANWFMVQYHEEMLHAMKFYEYVLRQGGQIRLNAIAKPPETFTSAMDMFQQTIKHEQFITQCINDLSNLAVSEKDHASQVFLQWYVAEQVEEEENDNDVIAQLKLIGNDTAGLFMLDKDMAARMLTVPSDFSKGVEAALKTMGKA